MTGNYLWLTAKKMKCLMSDPHLQRNIFVVSLKIRTRYRCGIIILSQEGMKDTI